MLLQDQQTHSDIAAKPRELGKKKIIQTIHTLVIKYPCSAYYDLKVDGSK